MDKQEKLVMRAQLIASGVIRWWQFDKSKDVHDWLQILAEEVAKIEDVQIADNIRDALLVHGLRLPACVPPCTHAQDGTEVRPARKPSRDQDGDKPEKSTVLYVRRANNQVSEYTEAHIRELLDRKMAKSAVARALRVNRRVVIRVAREAQSAQQPQKSRTNDLGRVSEEQ
jgi:hypothetical protein